MPNTRYHPQSFADRYLSGILSVGQHGTDSVYCCSLADVQRVYIVWLFHRFETLWHKGLGVVLMPISRPEVATVADYGTLNFRGEQEYTLHGKNVSICGGNESIVTEIFNVLDEGTFPKTENEAMISINAKDTLKLKIGEQIVITTPNGTEFSYIISGFMKNSANLKIGRASCRERVSSTV